MAWTPIIKSAKDRAAAAWPDPDAVREGFSWAEAARQLIGHEGDGGVNIAHAAVERHVEAGHGAAQAVRWLGPGSQRRVLTYADLSELSSRIAHVLAAHGLCRGSRIFTLMDRVPELPAVALGAWKAGMVFAPLFPAFGPDPIRTRLEAGAADALITTESLYLRKIAPYGDRVRRPELVFILGDEAHDGAVNLMAAIAAAPAHYASEATGADDPATLHFTSGTSGPPKPVIHGHGAVVHQAVTGRHVLELSPGRAVWCTADPGWVTATSYGIIAPLANRSTIVMDGQRSDPARAVSVLAAERVAVWYTSPVVLRAMMRAYPARPHGFDFRALRHVASVGEPLSPDAIAWGRAVLGRPIHDTWWQTETGGIIIAHTAGMNIKPGALGKPVPGVDAAIVARTDCGLRELGHGQMGELALRIGWPGMMAAGSDGSSDRFEGDLYLSGDLAFRDADGFIWFVGRSDDLIKTSGQTIGPVEVENILQAHPAVSECGVVGLPDPILGQVVTAVVVLDDGYAATRELEKALLSHARKELGPRVAPRSVRFSEALPKTRSGKISRRHLRLHPGVSLENAG